MGVEKYIIYDVMEKETSYVTALNEMGYTTKREKLESADLTFYLNSKDYRNEFLVELKSGYQELFTNVVTSDRSRFKREWKRLEAVSTVILLIRQPSHEIALQRLKKRNYKMRVDLFPSKLKTFLKFRNHERVKAGVPEIKVVYCNRKDTATTIIKLINDYLKTNKNHV